MRLLERHIANGSMNNEEAKALLQGYHFDARVPQTPELAEALAQVARDPELLAWFQSQRALDAAVREKLQQVPIPEGLAARIVAGRPAQRASHPLRSLQILAFVASIALICCLLPWLIQKSQAPATPFQAMQLDLVRFLGDFPSLDLATDRLPAVRDWLNQQHPLTKANLPDSLERFPTIGCRTVKWENRQLALVCFMVDGEVMHVFVLPRAEFPDLRLSPTPEFTSVGSRNTAIWSENDNHYLVVTAAENDKLRRFLQPRSG